MPTTKEEVMQPIRERIFQQYRIVYRIKADAIEIVIVTHGTLPLPETV